MSRRPVDADCSATRRSPDRVGDQSISVVDVVDMDLFVFGDVRGEHQVVVNCDASLIMQLSVSHRGTMNLGFKQNSLHAFSKFSRNRLMRRGAGHVAARGKSIVAKGNDGVHDLQTGFFTPKPERGSLAGLF